MSLLFVFAFISLLIAGMQLTWPGRYHGWWRKGKTKKNRSNKKTLKIKKGKIISQIKLDVPTYSKKNLPNFLKKIPITKPGSRFN